MYQGVPSEGADRRNLFSRREEKIPTTNGKSKTEYDEVALYQKSVEPLLREFDSWPLDSKKAFVALVNTSFDTLACLDADGHETVQIISEGALKKMLASYPRFYEVFRAVVPREEFGAFFSTEGGNTQLVQRPIIGMSRLAWEREIKILLDTVILNDPMNKKNTPSG